MPCVWLLWYCYGGHVAVPCGVGPMIGCGYYGFVTGSCDQVMWCGAHAWLLLLWLCYEGQVAKPCGV